MRTLQGVIPNMVTPMDAKGRPDREGIYALVDFLVQAGVGGLWVLGSAGEDVHVSAGDRVTIAAETLKAVAGRIPVIIGLGPSTYYEILEFCDKVDVGAVTALHFLPYDTKLGDAGLQRYVLKLADVLPCPLWLYHNPARGRPITRAMAVEFRSHPNIHGIKVGGYSTSELTNMTMLRTDSFQVSGAGGGQMFHMLSLGAQVHMTSDANCYPEPFLELFKLFQEGKTEEARALQFRIIELSRKFLRTDNGEYAAEEKYILARRGVIREHVNPAYRGLTDNEKGRIDEALKEFGFPWA